MKIFLLILTLGIFEGALGYNNPYFANNRTTIVHLFEWKWSDIALECERFLGPKGFGGVQVSPINEHLIIPNRPWWERYQPVSYKINTRSGNEQQFSDMVKRCNFVGVRVYVDAILNHMTGNNGLSLGTAGSSGYYANYSYPEVAYSAPDFHTPPCSFVDSNDPIEARNCQLLGLRDLNQTSEFVRMKLLEFLNKLVDMGVAGFRIDAAKYMWPSDLRVIYSRLHNLNPSHGFPTGARPYIYQDITDLGGKDISRDEYTELGGAITEMRAGIKLGLSFRNVSPLKLLADWGPQFGLVKSTHSLVFMENHDNQRGHGSGGGIVLTYKDEKIYRASLAFLLAHPYGTPRIMSSYAFSDSEAGPPTNSNGDISSPEIGGDGSCKNEWVCEHRWNAIYQMIDFRNVVGNAEFSQWSSVGDGQIAFSRQGRGFIAINIENKNLTQSSYYTNIPSGTYCDIMTGGRVGDRCSGKVVTVASNYAYFDIKPDDKEHVMAIHVGSNSKLT